MSSRLSGYKHAARVPGTGDLLAPAIMAELGVFPLNFKIDS